jgi:hypothetical protein
MDDFIWFLVFVILVGLGVAILVTVGAVLLVIWALLEGSALIYRVFMWIKRKAEHSKPTP